MPRQIIINNCAINDETDAFVIAELGQNHQGSLETAKNLFSVAKECGVSAVKLQKRDNRSLYTEAMYNKPYENENSFGNTYGEHRSKLEFGRTEYQALQEYAQQLELSFFATAFDFQSADFLAELDMPAFKMASGDLTNIPLLKYVAKFQKPMVVSTGGGTLDDVRRAYEAVMPINAQLCLLQCTASYPAAFEELNLRVIETYREEFPDAVIGLSAHDNGIAMVTAAYVLGARVFEKHFTLNRAMKGTDHAFSLERDGMRRMIRDLKRLRVALGDGVKRVYESEKAPIEKMSKKLVAVRPLPADHVLTRDDIAIKSPGNGLPPYELESVIGRRVMQPLNQDDNITLENLNAA
jgi:sialic acid synthase